MMRPEDSNHRKRVVSKLNKREYYVVHRHPLPDQEQYINGFVREEWCILEKASDGTVKLCFITTPFHAVYGPEVMAKRRPNGRYWFISNAYADTLPPSYTDAMEDLYKGNSKLERFDANDLTKIYA